MIELIILRVLLGGVTAFVTLCKAGEIIGTALRDSK